MAGRADLRRVLPWMLCAVSLGMLVVGNWLRWLLRNQISYEYGGWLEGTISALGFSGIPVVGALIATRLPANPYGWLWCLTGLVYGMSQLVEPLVRIVGGPLWLAWVLELCGFVTLLGLLVFVFLLFPTGRLPSHGWRWLPRAAVATALLLVLAAPFTYDPDEPTSASPWVLPGVAGQSIGGVGLTVMFSLVMAGMLSLVVRFRRAEAVERQQLTWFLYATVVIAFLLVLDAVGLLQSGLVNSLANAAAFAMLPLAVGVAVLRYRLYEIDRIINRTVTYGLLTAAILAVYLLVVTGLSQLGVPDGSSDAVVAVVTLAVAGLVGRGRHRLQAAVDRRFDRARYDADRAVDAFAKRLRDQVDLDQVTAGLCDTVVATVAPTHVAVWLSVPVRSREL